SGNHIAHCGESFIHILGIDGCGEAELNVVRNGNGLLEIVRRNYRDDWAENLLLSNPHLWGNFPKNGRFMKVTFGEFSLRQRMSSTKQLGPFALADLCIVHDRLQLVLVHHWAHFNLRIKTITHLERLSPGYELIQKALINLLVHDNP